MTVGTKVQRELRDTMTRGAVAFGDKDKVYGGAGSRISKPLV